MVGLAFEVHDSSANLERLKKDGLSTDERNKIRLKCIYENVSPSILDSLFYCYSYIGLFTGMRSDCYNFPKLVSVMA